MVSNKNKRGEKMIYISSKEGRKRGGGERHYFPFISLGASSRTKTVKEEASWGGESPPSFLCRGGGEGKRSIYFT